MIFDSVKSLESQFVDVLNSIERTDIEVYDNTGGIHEEISLQGSQILQTRSKPLYFVNWRKSATNKKLNKGKYEVRGPSRYIMIRCRTKRCNFGIAFNFEFDAFGEPAKI